ncbi:hypothetical protein J3L18_22610 [Mucilaginibacter gossypii]|uniref:hypothetical protein n=1 Tax=Mucilaginibacter gossypii TaxID=551996 RepID=UPI000DCEB57A|nr:MULTISPECIES: hypothetical protein [Mucilaginibacter]QTE35915.1 hypothetical protein J3L18_22610 [Mucilaginibacter gossypii]RAV54720.1 hypothetical protein DIU36_20300 [Mucilaginibacter rubeus]
MIKPLLTILLSVITLTIQAQTFCEKITKLKHECYGFTPKSLSLAQREAKSAQLDKFWDLAKSNKKEAALCLKNLILAENNDSYFCFDASSLLLSLDETKEYQSVVLEGVKKSNLEDLDLQPYVQLSFFLGKKGNDISALAEKLLSYPNAHVSLTQHAITLNAIDASLFLYNTMSAVKAEKSLFNIIANGNSTGKHNAVVVLNMISTPKGDSLVNRLIQNKELPDSVSNFILKDKQDFNIKTACKNVITRADALQKLNASSYDENFICEAANALKPEDIEAVREARFKTTPGLSDEGLSRYFTLTALLITMRNK